MTLDKIKEYENIIHNHNVIVLPQFPYLSYFNQGLYSLGSQDVSKFKRGSYTGEVCAKALKDIGCKYVLVGHSERKKYFNESLSDIKDKISNVIDNEMIPIICINQTKKDESFSDIDYQTQFIPNNIKNVIVAYEPDWLIGSNETIDIDYLKKAILKIKECLMEKFINHSIIYGGNVNSKNIEKLTELNELDGVIMSTSALDVSELNFILDKYK